MVTKRNPQREARTAYLHVRIEPDVLARFRQVAEADHRTVSQDVRRYIDHRLSEAEKPVEQAA
jgi:hypothetical protein